MSESISFELLIDGAKLESLNVIRFEAREAMSDIFDYTITAEVSIHQIEDLKRSALKATGEFQAKKSGKTIRKTFGIFRQINELKYLSERVIIEFLMVPRLWLLTQHRANDVYLALSTTEIAASILEKFELTSGKDFFFETDFAIKKRKWEFKLQYQETYYDFLTRLLERDGLHFYFEHEQTDKIIISNRPTFESSFETSFLGMSEREKGRAEFGVKQFMSQSKRLPKSICFKDFNFDTPNADIKAEADIDVSEGIGEVEIYGFNIRDNDEAEKLANAHAQSFLITKTQHLGQTNDIKFAAGYPFKLIEHPNKSYNAHYLVLSVKLSGANQSFIIGEETQYTFNAEFTAIDKNHQFVKIANRQIPKVVTQVHAVIDSDDTTGDYPFIDEHGRYKVKLPFDNNQREKGKASHWIRLAHHFGGPNEGLHFPLRKGTHVLLTFLDGNPDLPLITATIPDFEENKSIINDELHTTKAFVSNQENRFVFEDNKENGDNRHIHLYSPSPQTFQYLGTFNDYGKGYILHSAGLLNQYITKGSRTSIGLDSKEFDPTKSWQFSKSPKKGEQLSNKDEIRLLNDTAIHLYRRRGEYQSFTAGDEFFYSKAHNKYMFGPQYNESHVSWDNKSWHQNTFSKDQEGRFSSKKLPSVSIDQNNSVTRKVFGDTYNYAEGEALEIHKGDITRAIYGSYFGEVGEAYFRSIKTNGSKLNIQEHLTASAGVTISYDIDTPSTAALAYSLSGRAGVSIDNKISTPASIQLDNAYSGASVNKSSAYKLTGAIEDSRDVTAKEYKRDQNYMLMGDFAETIKCLSGGNYSFKSENIFVGDRLSDISDIFVGDATNKTMNLLAGTSKSEQTTLSAKGVEKKDTVLSQKMKLQNINLALDYEEKVIKGLNLMTEKISPASKKTSEIGVMVEEAKMSVMHVDNRKHALWQTKFLGIRMEKTTGINMTDTMLEIQKKKLEIKQATLCLHSSTLTIIM